MREIKFRAWDKEINRMYHDVGVIPPHYKPARVAEDGKWSLHTNSNSTPLIPYNTQRYEIMQYTGLTDRNGVEIYEGDIVTDYLSINNSSIEWSGTHCCFYVYTISDPQLTKQLASNIEVVGNIYEEQAM